LEGGPPGFARSFTSSVLLWYATQDFNFRVQDYHLLWSNFPDRSTGRYPAYVTPATPGRSLVWASPLSHAATNGVSVDLLSCRYLDVQFPAFASHGLYIHPWMTGIGCPFPTGFPIRTSRDYRLFDTCPGLFAVYHVLRRLSTPRHSPYTLSNLTISIED